MTIEFITNGLFVFASVMLIFNICMFFSKPCFTTQESNKGKNISFSFLFRINVIGVMVEAFLLALFGIYLAISHLK